MEKRPTLMKKGVDELRKQQNFVWNHPNTTRIHPSKASLAVKAYYEKQVSGEEKRLRKSSFISNYIPEMEELQNFFLMRPDCPQYRNQGTSVSPVGKRDVPRSTSVICPDPAYSRISDLPINPSTISLSSQISLDDWNSILMKSDGDSKSHTWIQCSSVSETVCRMPKWKSFTEQGIPSVHSGNKIPWYIPVLHDKDMALHKLEEDLARMAHFESECVKKDEVIEVLMEEVKELQQQLDAFQEGRVPALKEPPYKKCFKKEDLTEMDDTQKSRQDIRQTGIPTISLEKSDVLETLQQEEEEPEMEQRQSDLMTIKTSLLNEMLLKDQQERGLLEKEQAEIDDKGMLGSREEAASISGSKAASEGEMVSQSSEDSENSLILYKLWEFQKVNEELFEELQRMKNEYDIATGTVSSLQRQLSFEKSQLRTAHVDRDVLEKELQERGAQLEAMSNKFCNLREERKHEDLMGSIERDNYKLRQEVSGLQSQLAEKSHTIQELQNTVGDLQTEMLMSQSRSAKQLTLQSDLQHQLEVLQRAEQQTRVTLESISARFDRFRSKIIQATYSTPGTKSPQAEITDEEVLESLQKIISDRLEFHQLLKQKGIKIPSFSGGETTPPAAHKKKAGNK